MEGSLFLVLKAMAIAVNFSAQALRQRTFPRAMADLALNPLPSQTSHRLELKRTKQQPNGVAIKKQEQNKLTYNRGVSSVMLSSNSDIESILGQPSAADTIKDFYMCINEKNLKGLEGYISEDCYIEDCSFYNPFNGKREVIHFFDLLIGSMGQNVKFIIEHICEGDSFTAGVNWHLEWKQTQIPFTRGCSFYECSEEGEILESSDHYRVTSETRGSGAGPVEERDYNIRRVPAGCRMVLEESACDITMVTEDLRNIRGTFDKPTIGRLRKNREIHGGVVCFGHQNRGLHLEDFLQVVVN
ncbi:pentatricopeptide repeat-containing protein [Gossypium australe]|uniref:Pentatricopeptide repeat-containing protein n=1 Tax=Gossypium australe TaxID=47621 RepID=A0A5B6UVH2_9ROSI|nr:pentatricopeptide repeat-containing protein [Gossypium australe]